MKPSFFSLLSFLILPFISFSQDCVPAETVAFFDKAMKEINPSHSRWVRTTAADTRSGKTSIDDVSKVASVYNRGVNLSAMDLEALVMFVMMQAAREAEKDMQDILDEMKKQNEQKKKLREVLNKLRQEKKDPQQLLRSAYDSLIRLADPALVRVSPTSIAGIQPAKVTLAEYEELLDRLRDKLDSMNEITEMASLRLQMLMDRRSKLMSTLANLLKKISRTSDAIIQNLK